ncbi:hypothetical protein ES676_02520 [Bizionia saleffrena]|uniref:Uncharacterized protein n=1 Tax=Bizionia saleffrena TaxID=291189 RepID=A0A8H2QGC1_9FLAO|nr:hypothetical protein [Bizionia saleffrena]TYB78105.1 hypothetical protein ES676_02520 [Bizionia saleffrena]
MSTTDSSKTLTREELYNLVWCKPLSKIMEEYSITNSSLKHICKKNDIPLPKNGHWQKLKFNKKVTVTPLSKSIKENGAISFQKEQGVLSELNILVREIKNDKLLPLKVSDKLTKPDMLVIEAMEGIKNGEIANDWDYKRFYRTSQEVFNIFVHKDTINRALNFSDALIKLFRKRGHEIEVKTGEAYNENGTRLIVDGEAYKVCVRETRKRIKVKSEHSSYLRTSYVPTGILTLRIEDLYGHQWSDSVNKKIEDKLPNILAYLELRAKKDKKERIERKAWRLEYERKRKIEEELVAKRKDELDVFISVINQSSRWQKSMDLRNYVETVKVNAVKNNKLTDELQKWLKWINDKADWYDPLIEKEDELFENIDRDTLTENK